MTSIQSYYGVLAEEYDRNRFANSYGQFIDSREKQIVMDWISKADPKQTLDLGCGTGRFLEFAQFGVDVSEEMLKVAKAKFPDRILKLASASNTGYQDAQFCNILSFHVLMHLEMTLIEEIFQEVHRLLQPGGHFIFDFPSLHRRKWFKRKAEGWHGATSISMEQIETLCNHQWKLERVEGILFIPIHRIPGPIRPMLKSLDRWLGRSFLKRYASYMILKIQKR